TIRGRSLQADRSRIGRGSCRQGRRDGSRRCAPLPAQALSASRANHKAAGIVRAARTSSPSRGANRLRAKHSRAARKARRRSLPETFRLRTKREPSPVNRWSGLQRQHMIAQRTRIVKGIVRDLAVRCGAEAGELDEFEAQRRDFDHRSGSRQEQHVELRDVFRPVGHDQRLGVAGEIVGDRARRIAAVETRRNQGLGDHVEVRDDIPLYPLIEYAIPVEGQVKLLAAIRNQRQRQQRAAPAIIFSVEEVPQRWTAGQSSVGKALPLRQRSAISRARRPRSSSCFRSSRPRFWSASAWLVVAASTRVETTFTGRVTTSTAVCATVPTTQPESVNAKRMERRFTGSDSQKGWAITIASLLRRALRPASGAPRRLPRPAAATPVRRSPSVAPPSA